MAVAVAGLRENGVIRGSGKLESSDPLEKEVSLCERQSEKEREMRASSGPMGVFLSLGFVRLKLLL